MYYGLQMQANGIIRISTPRLSTASSSNTSTTTTSGTTGTHNYITSITDNGDGSISWSWREMSTINGLVTSF